MGNLTKEEYEADLKSRQQKHLEGVRSYGGATFQPCMHDQCTECIGTGIRNNGEGCVHWISCKCPKCSPVC